jgi:hypothetical protein
MTEAAEVDAGLRQSREQTVLAHLEAENRQDVAATLATFKPGAARTELPGEVADGPDAVAATYRELFTALQTCTSTSSPAHCVTTVTA